MFKTILTAILGHFGVTSAFAAILEPVIEGAADTLLGDATVAAQPIVAALEKGTLPNEQKLETAVTQLVAALKAEGKTLLSQTAHLAVELALAKIRAAI